MTMKIHGRRISADHLRYGMMADNVEIGHVSRGQLVGLAQKLPILGIINGTEAHLLTVLLNTAPAASFNRGGKPIVFKSNKQLAFEIGRSEGRVSRLLSRLYACGLIVMRDSGNFKRYPVCDSGGNMITACGIDLRVFIARYQELQQCVDEASEINRQRTSALRRFKGLYRQIQTCVEMIELSPFISRLLARVQRIIGMIKKIKDKEGGILKIEKSIHLLNWILCRLNVVNMSKTTCLHVENDIHIHNTTPKSFCNCNKNRSLAKAKQNYPTDVAYGYENTAYEKMLARTAAPLPKNDSLLAKIKPHILIKALPMVKIYLKEKFQSLNDIKNNFDVLSKIMGISNDALIQAKTVMGLEKTALSIGIILEKYNRGMINSPGGYLRSLIAREKKGELYLERSFFSLLKQSE